MSTFTPFLCPVTPYGTPHFVPLSSASKSSILSNLTANEMCRAYWLLESVLLEYQFTLNNSLVVNGDLLLGGMYGVLPRNRLLSPTFFSAGIYHSAYGIQSEAKIDFSTIYAQSNEHYAAIFDFVAYNLTESVDGSQLLLSFYRSSGSSGQRNQCKTRNFQFLGSTHTAYLNYNDQIWPDTEISLDKVVLTTTFFENPQISIESQNH